MRSRACFFRGLLLIAALLFGAAATAEELSVDPNAFDASSVTTAKTKTKGKKAAVRAHGGATAGVSGQPGKTPDRQLGELEGWSPGKAPPKKKEDEPSDRSGSGTTPVSVSPSGGMSVGVPF